MKWLNKGIRDYHNLLKDKTQIKEDTNTNWIVISTPFIGAFNDTIEIFVKKINQIILSNFLMMVIQSEI